MIRLYLPNELRAIQKKEHQASATLPTSITIFQQECIHYLTKVMRVRSGQQLHVFAQGIVYQAHITNIQAKQVSLLICSVLPSYCESPLSTYFAQSISRTKRMDYSVQKATELGVTEFIPLYTKYSQISHTTLSEKQCQQRIHHWREIAKSAAEQSYRTYVPRIHYPIDLHTWLASVQAKRKLVFHECGTQPLTYTAQATPTSVAILSGPEGGLSTPEIQAAQQHGFDVIRLGPRVLRTESLAPVALGIVQFLWGDLAQHFSDQNKT